MPTFAVTTFGCQMNVHDSERIAEVLGAAGYRQTDEPEAADVVVVNTCSIRDKAVQKLRSELGRLALVKQRRRGMVLAVAGCVAQQEGEKLTKRVPAVDIVIGPDNIGELPRLLADAETGAPPAARTEFDLAAPRFLSARPVPGRAPASVYVTLMKGCNERCSYCIVPYTRGPERYRSSAEVVAEVSRWVAAGAKEVSLLGQTVNSYRDPLQALPEAPEAGESSWQHTHNANARSDESEFPALLRAIAERVPDLARLRYTSPHPRHLTRSLIRAHRELPQLARHLHLPVQSGSDPVLKRMIRRYTVAEYLERIAALREAVPGVTISTDIIVGFPGETEDDFECTLALVRRAEFSGVFGFKYSPRPFTPALNLGDDVPEQVKAARLSQLFDLMASQRTLQLEQLVGSEQQVLVQGPGKGEALTGRTERNEIVHFAGPAALTGRLCTIRIVEAFKNSLWGELRDPVLASVEGPVSGPRALPVI